MKENFKYYIKVKCGNIFLYVKDYIDIIRFTNDLNEALIVNKLSYEKVSSICNYLQYTRNYKCYIIEV